MKNLKHDIFIAFDPADNQSPDEIANGWVDNFRRFLGIMLRQFIGREITFLDVESGMPDSHELEQVKIVLYVMTPASCGSEKIISMISDFNQLCNRVDESTPKFASRIYKIVKYPVPMADQPGLIRSLIPYDLYDFEPNAGKIREIKNFFSKDAELNYWMKLVDLAYDINEVLASFEQVSGLAGSEKGEKKSIFLAETGPELMVQRNMIKRELLRQGYQIFPSQNLPADPAELNPQITSLLEHCDFSIHLMGDQVAASGTISHPIAEIQNNAVSLYIKQLSRDPSEPFLRLIWLSPQFRVRDEKQHAFLENMRRELEEIGHTEIFQTPFEDFRFILKNALLGSAEMEITPEWRADTGQSKKVYVIYDKIDEGRAGELVRYLKNKGLQVEEPVFEGDLLGIRQLHIQNLIDFDSVIIFSGQVNEYWVKMKLLDILKSPGFGRLKPLNQKAIITDSGGKIDAGDFKDYEVDLLENEGNDFRVLDEFISKM